MKENALKRISDKKKEMLKKNLWGFVLMWPFLLYVAIFNPAIFQNSPVVRLVPIFAVIYPVGIAAILIYELLIVPKKKSLSESKNNTDERT